MYQLLLEITQLSGTIWFFSLIIIILIAPKQSSSLCLRYRTRLAHSGHFLQAFWTRLARIPDVCECYLGAELRNLREMHTECARDASVQVQNFARPRPVMFKSLPVSLLCSIVCFHYAYVAFCYFTDCSIRISDCSIRLS